ncbi:uncharacterized protein METZ01_LOCUS429504, partial [marine metagenome]
LSGGCIFHQSYFSLYGSVSYPSCFSGNSIEKNTVNSLH